MRNLRYLKKTKNKSKNKKKKNTKKNKKSSINLFDRTKEITDETNIIYININENIKNKNLILDKDIII